MNIGGINIPVNNGADGGVAYFTFETTYTCRKRPVPVALPVAAESLRFSRASHGMIVTAAIKIAIPKSVGVGSLWPLRARADATAT